MKPLKTPLIIQESDPVGEILVEDSGLPQALRLARETLPHSVDVARESVQWDKKALAGLERGARWRKAFEKSLEDSRAALDSLQLVLNRAYKYPYGGKGTVILPVYDDGSAYTVSPGYKLLGDNVIYDRIAGFRKIDPPRYKQEENTPLKK